MNHRSFLSGVRRPAHSRRHESRRGAPSTLSTLLFASASFLLAALPATAGAVQSAPTTETLIPSILAAQPIAERIATCAPTGACLVRNPLRPLSEALAVDTSFPTPSDMAHGLLPRSSRWLRTARTHRDEPLTVRTIFPDPREMGMPIRKRMRAFELILGPDSSHAALMFLSGLALFLFSSVLGITALSPRDPVVPAPSQTGQRPLLPMLLAHPKCPVTGRRAS